MVEGGMGEKMKKLIVGLFLVTGFISGKHQVDSSNNLSLLLAQSDPKQPVLLAILIYNSSVTGHANDQLDLVQQTFEEVSRAGRYQDLVRFEELDLAQFQKPERVGLVRLIEFPMLESQLPLLILFRNGQRAGALNGSDLQQVSLVDKFINSRFGRNLRHLRHRQTKQMERVLRFEDMPWAKWYANFGDPFEVHYYGWPYRAYYDYGFYYGW